MFNNQQYLDNQNYIMQQMNMMNQNNMNNFCPNDMPMNMMNQYNNNFMQNQNNMNMNMMMIQYLYNNMMNNINNMNNNWNMNMNNNMGNPGFNNMYNNNNQNWPGNGNNMNDINNYNSKIFLMKNMYEQLKFEEDPYRIQKGIAFCLDNNKSNGNHVCGGNPLFTTSSNDENFQNNNSKDIINIIFLSMKGNKHNRKYNQNDKIRNVLENFLEGFGLPKNALKEIQFLYNAVNLNNLNENVILKDFNIKDFARINIIDMKNIIGA
jgi:hypothetical protein